MMYRLILSLVVVFGASQASGQTLRVQSGDHAGFTRLVIPIGTDRQWEIVQQDSRNYTVLVDPAVDGFDTSAAFTLIQRNRLANLSGDEALTLTLACACEVSSFLHQGEYLVVDIADGDPLANAEPDAGPLADEADGRADERERAADALPDLASLLLGPNQLPELNNTPEVPVDEEVVATPTPPNPRLAEAAEIMAEQLARAAAAGLLDASLGQPQTFADPVDRANPQNGEAAAPETQEVEDQPIQSAALEDTPSPHASSSELPIRTHTALDPILSFDTPLSPANATQACTSDPFAAREWSDAESFDEGLGELRAALYDERDNLIVEGAQRLALHYLSFGFGAEARHWLDQYPEPSEDFMHVAALVDGAETAAFDPVTSTADCSQGEILWRYIAGAVQVDLNNDDLAKIQRAYAELPIHLRDLMGPRLARMLHADRHGPAARNIRDILDRGGRISEAELHFLDLDLNISLAMSEAETRNAFSEMLANSGADAVDTMAQALGFDRRAEIAPTAERLTAAEALLREAGNGSQTDALWREVLLGYAAQGEIDTAIAMLDTPDRAASARQTALTALIADRVAVEDTTGLLILAYTFGDGWQPEGSNAGRAQVSAIALLRAEGLFEAAQILTDVRRPLILPAREDPEAGTVDPLMEAWETADWSELAEHANGPHAEVAARMIARAEGLNGTDTVSQDLATLSGTVDDSRSLREAISGLLNQPSPD